jgi:glycerol-1-phosphate dehydrogenase [NAD(P)+]
MSKFTVPIGMVYKKARPLLLRSDIMINAQTFSISDYLNRTFSCNCGRSHRTDLKDVEISSGAVEKIPYFMKRYGYTRAFIVCDCNTFKVCGNAVKSVLDKAGLANTIFTFSEEELVPDEAAIGELMVAFDKDADLIIAVGTGTINDSCKFVSYQMKRDYFVVATAPSMDGFASTGAPLITDHLKTTYEAHTPQVIIGDLDILCKAPMNMITAGLGDILGKYTCLTDWKISHIINGEYYCETIAEMVEVSIKKVTDNIELVKTRDPKVIQSIMEALVLTGIAMSFVGNSRPASGSEHHISHFWEMKFLFEGRKPVLHGTKVGIGTVAIAYLYSVLKTMKIDFEKARLAAKNFDCEKWEKKIYDTYSFAAPGVIQLEKKVRKNAPETHAVRIANIEKHWPEIIRIMDSLPPLSYIEQTLSELGAPINPAQVGVDYQSVVDSIVVAKEVRDRYTLLQLLWDLGITEEMAVKAADYFKNEQKVNSLQ